MLLKSNTKLLLRMNQVVNPHLLLRAVMKTNYPPQKVAVVVAVKVKVAVKVMVMAMVMEIPTPMKERVILTVMEKVKEKEMVNPPMAIPTKTPIKISLTMIANKNPKMLLKKEKKKVKKCPTL